MLVDSVLNDRQLPNQRRAKSQYKEYEQKKLNQPHGNPR